MTELHLRLPHRRRERSTRLVSCRRERRLYDALPDSIRTALEAGTTSPADREDALLLLAYRRRTLHVESNVALQESLATLEHLLEPVSQVDASGRLLLLHQIAILAWHEWPRTQQHPQRETSPVDQARAACLVALIGSPTPAKVKAFQELLQIATGSPGLRSEA